MKRILDRQPHRTEVFHADPMDGDTFYIETIEDVEPVVELAKLQADNPSGLKADGMRREAEIPAYVMDQALREGWTPADWKRWANDPDNRAFRVEYGGRVKRL